MFRAHQVMVSRTMRMLGRMGKHHSFWAMYSLRMSFWIVPESRSRSQPRSCATTTYMASRIHAVGLIVIETLICSRSMPSKSSTMSSTTSTATPSRPTSPMLIGSSES